jgi:DNA-binding Lrp family transcriptional regulator
MATPTARHVIDVLGKDLLLFNLEGAAEGVVVKRPRLPGYRHLEAGQVSAATTPVAERCHTATLAPADLGPGDDDGPSGSSVSPMLHAFVLIDAEPARVADLAGELADVDGVAEVYSVAGDADLVAVIRVRHHDELAELVTRRIFSHPGIVETRTLIAFQAYSRHDLEAMWDLGGP